MVITIWSRLNMLQALHEMWMLQRQGQTKMNSSPSGAGFYRPPLPPSTPPYSNPRHHRYRWIGWRSRPFCPNPQKVTRRNHTHLQQCAPPPVLEQVDRRSRPVFEGIGGRPPIPGLEPPPSRQTPGALPLERPSSEKCWNLAQGKTAHANTHTTHAGASAPPSLPTLCMAVC